MVWRMPRPVLSISSAIFGGGLRTVEWVINMTVDPDYARMDPVHHLDEAARSAGLTGEGVVLMTAVDVGSRSTALVRFETPRSCKTRSTKTLPPACLPRSAACALVRPAPRRASHVMPPPAGTINLVLEVPVRLSPAALVNLVATVTEAKVQALLDHDVPGTGTASDAVCIVCPTDGDEQLFGGPRSQWGGSAAQATYEVVVDGLLRQRG